MTALDLVDFMKAYIKNETQDLILPTRVDRKSGEHKERPAEVFTMRLPDKEAETKRIPYVLVQFIKSEDLQEDGQYPETRTWVRIVGATYSEDSEEGARCILNLLTRIKLAFLRDGMLADRYVLKPPLETIVYTDSTAPYYLGEMMTIWSMPIIESEVNLLWQQ